VHALAILTKPILIVTGFLTNLLSRGEPEGVSRGELQVLVNMAQSHGAIQKDESRVLSNLLGLDSITVADVMTPRTVVKMVSIEATVGDTIHSKTLSEHSRIPVFASSPDQVKGYVLQRELLRFVAGGGSPDSALLEFIRPIATMTEATTLGEALRTFLDTRDHVAVVSDTFGGTSGLVTLEDVVETLLGAEIVDEADRVEDLRELAMQIRDRRMARRSTEGSEATEPAAEAPAE